VVVEAELSGLHQGMIATAVIGLDTLAMRKRLVGLASSPLLWSASEARCKGNAASP